jgi:hypothetical protein
MSHFTVLVAADNEEHLNERLAPFYEQYYPGNSDFEEAFNKGWVVFDDMSEEWLKEYESDEKVISAVKLADGSVYTKWDKQFKNPDHKMLDDKTPQYIYPDDSEHFETAAHEVYKTFAEYVHAWHGADPTERLGYWNNPQAKWDWWVIGGRWNGLLKLKNENGRPDTATRGRPGVMGSLNTDIDRCDSALSKNINWQGMKQEDIDYRAKRWEALHRGLEIAAQLEDIDDVIHAFDTLASEVGKEQGWSQLDSERLEETYARNPEVSHEIWPTILDYARYRFAEFYAEAKRNVDFFMTTYDETKELLLPFDEYMEKYNAPARTFAFIDTEGKWNERGDMGWFGMVMDEQPDYDNIFWKFIDALEDDQRLYVVDCHI